MLSISLLTRLGNHDLFRATLPNEEKTYLMVKSGMLMSRTLFLNLYLVIATSCDSDLLSIAIIVADIHRNVVK